MERIESPGLVAVVVGAVLAVIVLALLTITIKDREAWAIMEEVIVATTTEENLKAPRRRSGVLATIMSKMLKKKEKTPEPPSPATRRRSSSGVELPIIPIADNIKHIEEDDDDDDTISSSSAKSGSSSSGGSGSRNKSTGKISPLAKLTSPKQQPVQNPTLTLRVDASNPMPKIFNSAEIVKLVAARVKRGPSESDTQGFIYMYQHKQDLALGYRKIGRTKRLPERRLKEWKGSVLVESWRVKRNKHAEVLIHWVLDFARVYRYEVGKDATFDQMVLVTRWKNGDKAIIKDHIYNGWAKANPEQAASLDLDKLTSHIEWFILSGDKEKLALDIIQSICTDINNAWKEEPWRKDLEALGKR